MRPGQAAPEFDAVRYPCVIYKFASMRPGQAAPEFQQHLIDHDLAPVQLQ